MLTLLMFIQKIICITVFAFGTSNYPILSSHIMYVCSENTRCLLSIIKILNFLLGKYD